MTQGMIEKSILLIEDDDAFRQVTSEVLDCLGYTVNAVNNLSSAISALRRAEFDIILSDLCISGDRDG
ncbi:MAG: response regulator, partial [Candidatus Coatesbacteria bacterium]|nr:response regulator [Candidatus Coatesbacteria bacterium]